MINGSSSRVLMGYAGSIVEWDCLTKPISSRSSRPGFAGYSWWATSRAANAAERQAAAAEKSLEIGNRAWVNASSPKYSSGRLDQNFFQYNPSVRVQKYGNTPALKFRGACMVKLFDELPNQEVLNLELQNAVMNNNPGILGPGEVASNLYSPVVKVPIQVAGAQGIVVLFGKAEYEDIFGKTYRTSWFYYSENNSFVQGPFNNEVSPLTETGL